MKKSIKIGLLSIVLIATSVVNASNLNDVKVSYVAKEKKLDISLSSVLKGEVLSITSKEGNMVYKETLSEAASFLVSIDFSIFEQGVYYMKSTTDSKVEITPIIIVPQQLKVIQGKTDVHYKPVFNVKDNMLNVEVTNKAKKPITIIVYAGSNKINITKDNTSEFIYKSYDLSYLTTGEYSVVVMDGDYIFNKDIRI